MKEETFPGSLLYCNIPRNAIQPRLGKLRHFALEVFGRRKNTRRMRYPEEAFLLAPCLAQNPSWLLARNLDVFGHLSHGCWEGMRNNTAELSYTIAGVARAEESSWRCRETLHRTVADYGHAGWQAARGLSSISSVSY